MSSNPNDQTESLDPSQVEGTADFQPPPSGNSAAMGDTTDLAPPHSEASAATADIPPVPSDATGNWQANPNPPADGGTGAWQPFTTDFGGDRTGAWQPDQGPSGATADFQPGMDAPSQATADLPSGSVGPTSGTEGRATGTHHRRVADLTAGAPVGAFPPATPQMRSGRYHAKKFHAKGGMGEIWLADDADIGRLVALKKMRGNPRDDQKDQFLREAQITGQLEHPGVVPIHDMGIDEAGQPFYIMKFIQGRTLTDDIKAYHSPPEPGAPPREVQLLRLLQTFQTLCQTVAFAHSHKVIHRDIKPDNVMVGAYGETLLLDWGLAKPVGVPEETDELHAPVRVRYSFSGESLETMDGAVKGTPSYFAPEVAQGKVAEVDESSDIYLLGGTLYHILTGKKPREAKKIQELIALASKQPPPAPRKLDPTIPKPLEAICMKAMAHRKEDRYTTAAALAEDLQRYLAGEPVSAYRESLWERTLRWIKRHRVLLSRAAVLLVVMGLVAFGVNEIHEANKRAEKDRIANEKKLLAEKAKSERLQKIQKATADVQAFARLADDTQRLFALQQPGSEQIVAAGADETERKAEAAAARLAPWGKDLTELPLADKREATKQQLYEVLMLLAESQSRRGTRKDAARDTLKLLDQAAVLRTPTTGLLRLRADCYRLLDDKAQADQSRKQMESAPWLALDHFLTAERLRAEHAAATQGREMQAWTKDQEKLFESALEEYRKAVKADYKYFWAHFQLSQGYLTLHKEPLALSVLDSCVALRPNSPWGYAYRGQARAVLRRFDAARADLEQAIKLDEELREPRMIRGMVNWLDKKYDKALADFAAALKPPAEKQVIEAFYYRGQMYLERREEGDEDKALDDFSSVIEKRRAGHPASLRRARIYFGRVLPENLPMELRSGDRKLIARFLQDLDQAIARLKYLKKDPSFQLGMEDLKAFLKRGGQFDPKAPAVSAQRGQLIHRIAREFSGGMKVAYLLLALEQLDQAIALGTQSYQVFDELGAVLSALGKIDKAVVAFTRAVALAPKGAQAPIWRKLGWKYEELATINWMRGLKAEEQEKLADAQKAFEKAIALDRQNAEGYAGLGYIQASRGQASVAASSKAIEAVLLTPGDWLLLHNVACVYGKLAQKAHKRKDLKRAREYEDNALVILHREVELWDRDRTGGNARNLIRVDGAFSRELREREEFKKLIEPSP